MVAALARHLPARADGPRAGATKAYRIWHGASHLDDARQAPVRLQPLRRLRPGPDNRHALHARRAHPGPRPSAAGTTPGTSTSAPRRSRAGDHRPRAGDRECFGVEWDADHGRPGGAQRRRSAGPTACPTRCSRWSTVSSRCSRSTRRSVMPFPGIVEPTLEQYTHLGDGATKTDNRVYSDSLGRSSPTAAAQACRTIAGPSRPARRPFNYLGRRVARRREPGARADTDDALAKECLETATHAWERRARAAARSSSSPFNTTGGHAVDAEVRAAVELLARDARRRTLPQAPRRAHARRSRSASAASGWTAARAIPLHGRRVQGCSWCRPRRAHKASLDEELGEEPLRRAHHDRRLGRCRRQRAGFAVSDVLPASSVPGRRRTRSTRSAGVGYLLGRHPASSLSYVSSVGTRVEAGRLRLQPGRLLVHPGRHRPGRGDRAAGLPRDQATSGPSSGSRTSTW